MTKWNAERAISRTATALPVARPRGDQEDAHS